MSYIVRDETPNRVGGRLLLAGGAVVLLVVAVVAFVAGGAASSDDAAPRVTWSVVGEQPLPSSHRHGPWRTADGLASGFSHDELGAALAAMHISARLLTSSPPAVSEATARTQCYGDVESYLARIRRAAAHARPQGPEAVGTTLYYRVLDGNPAGGSVRISLAAVTGEARSEGGFAELTRTLHWINGDWRMELPPPVRTVVASLDGYTLLGQADA